MPGDSNDIDVHLLGRIFAGVGLGSVACLAVLAAILAPFPVSTVALVVFFPCALALAWLAAGFRANPILTLLMMPIVLVVTPAIAGHVATVQQPWLLEPLAPLACEADETMVRTWEQRAVPSDGGGPAIYCEGPRGARQTYVPELVHMLGLTLFFGANFLLALLVRRRSRASSAAAR